jgi:hypothetical protein
MLIVLLIALFAVAFWSAEKMLDAYDEPYASLLESYHPPENTNGGIEGDPYPAEPSATTVRAKASDARREVA